MGAANRHGTVLMRLGGGARQGDGKPECRSAPGEAVEADGAAHQLDQVLADRGPESGSAELSVDAAVGLHESVEDPVRILARDPDAGVAHLEPQGDLLLGLFGRAGADADKAAAGELE